jgi:hypothetical protein
MTLTFRPDGTLTASTGPGTERGGRWTPQPHGVRLHLASAGQSWDVDAHLHGGSLTLPVDGRDERFDRDR